MSNPRLEQLLAFHQQDPDDPFIIYGLALEYQKSTPMTARSYFEILLLRFPEYLPSYYHAAKLYESFNEPETARDLYLKGIEVSINQKDAHAQRELQNAYTNLLFENDLE